MSSIPKRDLDAGRFEPHFEKFREADDLEVIPESAGRFTLKASFYGHAFPELFLYSLDAARFEQLLGLTEGGIRWGGDDQGERMFVLFHRDGFVWIAVTEDDLTAATELFKVRREQLEHAMSALP